MSTKLFAIGNEAIGYGAIQAGCKHFFGYPITPQNEIPAFFAQELPKVGGIFTQTESEISSINMLYGAAAAGIRALTSTSSPGFSLMQEGISAIATAEVPCVVVDVQRGGPGLGTTQTAQTDYLQATKSGAHGGCKNIVLAPASVQECHDFVQLAFYLADKYRMLSVVLSDGIIGQMREPLEVKKIEFGSLPEKTWAIKGTDEKGGTRNFITSFIPWAYLDYLERARDKYAEIIQKEVRYEDKYLEDAKLVIVAYGSSARIAMEAIEQARSEGIKVGLIRPITLWPFPEQIISEKSKQVETFLVIEDSPGQLIDDVKMSVEGRVETHLVSIFDRHERGSGGMIFPDKVYQEVKRLI
ncbi:MAG: 3-methyl-2-oxobutanoate dehydrogenase subunit VorB [Thermodesulfobacteriota bacterium]|nr:3-methyl-2-oxobutanoate dehydrogenase subunit VorB [Thermodesulfobacteriota bacterium]